MEQLPTEARRYIERLEEVSGVECAIVSTGSDRQETIVKPGSAVAQWLGVALLFVPLDEPHHRGRVGAEQLDAGAIARSSLSGSRTTPRRRRP